jgi:hypothetical protein
MRLVHLTSVAFGLNAGIDASTTLDISATRKSIEDGTVFELIEAHVQNVDLSLIRHRSEQKELLMAWQSLANAVDAKRKFGVQNDGVCLLLAYTIELIQSRGWDDNS